MPPLGDKRLVRYVLGRLADQVVVISNSVAENVLERDFSPAAPNQAWGTDITFLWTQEGWVYLAVVIDLNSRRVIGWSMDRRMKKALVIRALMMAINLRRAIHSL